MPEYEIHMVVRPVPDQFDRVFLKRTVDGPFLPRIGEYVVIGDGGWTEEVRSVWHEPGKRTVVEIGPPGDIVDGQEEGLADLARAAGWEGL